MSEKYNKLRFCDQYFLHFGDSNILKQILKNKNPSPVPKPLSLLM
jgi:hypothetical protein